MKPKLLLIGGGGHCRSCIDVIQSGGRFEVAGIVDNNLQKGSTVLGIPVLGSDEDVAELLENETRNVLVTVGQIQSSVIRRRIVEKLRTHGAVFPTIISPAAIVSPHANIGEGCVVMHFAVVNAGAKIGNFCIVNTRSICEHDTSVGDFCHVSTGAILNGGASAGTDCFFGSGSIIFQAVHIGDGVIIPAGSVIRKDIEHRGVHRTRRERGSEK